MGAPLAILQNETDETTSPTSLIVLSDGDLYTLPVALANLVGEHVQDTELMMAGAVLTVLPVIVLFVVLQRQYIAGILSGALKE